MKYKNNKGFLGIGMIIGIVAALVVGGGVVYFATKTPTPVLQNLEVEENNYIPVEQNDNQPVNIQPTASNVNNTVPSTTNNNISPVQTGTQVIPANNQPTQNSSDATLTIIKDSVPNHSQDFNFLVKGISSEPGVSNYSLNFILDDDQSSTTPNTRTLQLSPGTYNISETQIAGWTTGWSCAPGFEGGTDSGTGNTNTVDIGAGKSVTCTYTNMQTPISSCTPTTSPWIKLISPNGGEVYQAGQQITVRWESCNVSKTNQELVVSLWYGGPGPNTGNLFAVATMNDGIETFTIPQSSVFAQRGYQLGKFYKATVEIPGIDAQPQVHAGDDSDNLFTIN